MELAVGEAQGKLRIEDLQVGEGQFEQLYLAAIKSLALMIDARAHYTPEHVVRVQGYCAETARAMGLTSDEADAIEMAALLHDIGVLGVPERILQKATPLTHEEFARIRRHPEIGAAILERVPFPWPVAPVVRHHHEKWDGTGYPEGLAGEEIPLAARILAVADAYDAITSDRPHRSARTHAEGQAILRREAGAHFDPRVVDAFLSVIGGAVDEAGSERDGMSCAPACAASVRAA